MYGIAALMTGPYMANFCPCQAPPKVLFNSARCLAIAVYRGLPVRYYLLCGLVRVVLGSFSPREVQYLSPSTLDNYTNWLSFRWNRARVNKDVYLAEWLQHDVEQLPDGASSILWIGDRKKAKKIVYFLHGGGYILPITHGHLEWCLWAYVKAGEEEDVAVAVLQYSLAPGAKYPVQLCQAAAGLAHILRSGVRPRDLVFGGDSVGGNLTAQLIGHLLHPHPEAEAIHLEEPLAGIFAVSTWVSSQTDTPSFKENQYIDMLSPSIVGGCAGHWLATDEGYITEQGKGLGWAMANDVDGSWLEGLERVTEDVYVTVGRNEVLRDQGIAFAETIRERNPGVDVRLEVVEDEAHDWIMVEGMVGADGAATKRMKAWVSGVFWR